MLIEDCPYCKEPNDADYPEDEMPLVGPWLTQAPDSQQTRRWVVSCSCGAQGSIKDTWEEAIKVWNKVAELENRITGHMALMYDICHAIDNWRGDDYCGNCPSLKRNCDNFEEQE